MREMKNSNTALHRSNRHNITSHEVFVCLLSCSPTIHPSMDACRQVNRSHFLGALRGLTPSSQREGINPARPLPPHLSALLSDSLAVMSETLQVCVCVCRLVVGLVLWVICQDMSRRCLSTIFSVESSRVANKGRPRPEYRFRQEILYNANTKDRQNVERRTLPLLFCPYSVRQENAELQAVLL